MKITCKVSAFAGPYTPPRIEDWSSVAISGGFDPLHEGHVAMIKDIYDEIGHNEYDPVVVILNSDEWLMRKKGFVFMNFNQRKAILESIRGVDRVEAVDDSDGTVCEALRRIKPDYFANGGDRTVENTPELTLCAELGIKPIFNVGGKKIASSSELVNAVR